MKILLLSEFFPCSQNGDISGGVEARNYYFAKYASLKNDLTVMTSRLEKPHAGEIFAARVITAGAARQYVQKGDLIKRLIFIVACIYKGARLDFDLVEGTNWLTNFAALIIGKIKRKKICFWYPDVLLSRHIEFFGLSGVLLEALERLILFFGKQEKFIAISESTRNKLMRHGVPKNNIVVIPCGVDEEEVRAAPGKKLDLIKTKEYDLIVVNRLVKYKNTEMIVEAAIKNDWQILIVGDGEERRAIKKLIKRGGENVTILPGITHHIDLLRTVLKAKIYVSASSVEGFNIAALEAAALGLPCVLRDIPAHRELAKSLEGVLLFKNKEELKKRITDLLKNKRLFDGLSALNRENARQFTWKKVINPELQQEFYSRHGRS